MPIEVQTGVPGPTGPAGGLVSLNGDATGAQALAATSPVAVADVGATHTFSLVAAAVATLTSLKTGAGAPVNGSFPDGTFYFRTGGTQLGEYIYHAEGGAWVAIL